jgi:L-asparaginase
MREWLSARLAGCELYARRRARDMVQWSGPRPDFRQPRRCRVSFRTMQQGPEPIVIVTTGGTIDKAYFDALSVYQIGEPVVKKLLDGANVTHPYRIVELLRKDSLELTDEDRGRLRETVAAVDERRVVITHGTDTMTDSAQVLAAIPGKTIVLTGALSPARFSESDATFNIGMAFAAAQTLPAGVYIAMNGRVFRGDEVEKDREQRRFVAKTQ